MLGALVIDVSIDGAARLFAAPELSRSARYFGIGMAAIFPLIFLFRGLDRRAISVDRWVDPIWARRNRALAGLWWLPATILVRVPRALGRLPPIFIVLLITGWFVYLFLDQAFLTSFASRRPERAGIYAPLIGTLYMLVITAAVAFPAWGGCGDLPGGIRAQELVREDDPDQYRELGRGAVDRLWAAGGCNCSCERWNWTAACWRAP